MDTLPDASELIKQMRAVVDIKKRTPSTSIEYQRTPETEKQVSKFSITNNIRSPSEWETKPQDITPVKDL